MFEKVKLGVDGRLTSLTANFTSLTPGGIVPIKNVWEWILFFNFCNKKELIAKILFVKIRFIYAK